MQEGIFKGPSYPNNPIDLWPGRITRRRRGKGKMIDINSNSLVLIHAWLGAIIASFDYWPF